MKIDVYDHVKGTIFGSGKVQMARLLRQGNPKKIITLDVELFEPDLNVFVGTVQVLCTNEGRKSGRMADDDP